MYYEKFKPAKVDEDNPGYTSLTCPECGSNNLHHEHVTVTDRLSEDGDSIKTVVSTGQVTRTVVPDGKNPSARRGSVTVHFWCEQCHGGPDGVIAPLYMFHVIQHKGTTYLYWEIPKKELPVPVDMNDMSERIRKLISGR